ncbi:MAG: Tn3 family transposase [Candidatus Methanoperedens sp.]|nr:Tn3 family transposase [Candidatus Methanoperedens sp.]
MLFPTPAGLPSFMPFRFYTRSPSLVRLKIKNQEFAKETKEEQLIAEGCKRLIENAIICWNYLYISQKLADAPEAERKEMRAQMKKSSIITWHHINLLGEYDFSDEKLNTIIPFQPPKILELKVL